MRFKFLRLIKFVSLLFLSAAWMVPLNPSIAGAASNNIGFIDIQKAISNTKEWKRQFAAFKLRYKKEKVVISEREKKIKKMLEDLNKQSFVLNSELKKKKEDKFRKEKLSFERYVEDKNNEFAQKEKEMTRNLLRRMVEVIKKIGKDKKYTLILEHKAAIYHDSGHDLTDLAIKTYDKLHK
ncbi:MAG: OmpH family outer membrane protein [Nitrospinaceae bacterium]